jgi:predicted metal-dependent enzyme (double-stranded beta helix superfamily)
MNASTGPERAAEFPGLSVLVEMIDGAVRRPDPEAITSTLREGLIEAIREKRCSLPQSVYEIDPAGYARRELYRSPGLGYSVVAMTWGPGQGTPVHDHGGLWCVEGVWHGALEISQYDVIAEQDERIRLRAGGSILAEAGSAGSLIPPREYHAIRNPRTDALAVSLHIYEAPIVTCSMFEPIEGEWYARCMKSLTTRSLD